MAARVVLLILAVGAFVAIWSSDRRNVNSPRTDAVATFQDADGALQPPGIVLTDAGQRDSAGPDRTEIDEREVAVSRPLPMVPKSRSLQPVSTKDATESHSGIPLPGGITPGRFRVVRSDGRVLRIRLSLTELLGRGIPQTEPPRSLYLLHDGKIRWYFIRVESGKTTVTATTLSPQTDRQTPVAAVVASKPRTPVVARKPQSRRNAMRIWWERNRDIVAPTIDRMQQTAGRMQSTLRKVSRNAVERWWNLAAGSIKQIRRTARRPIEMRDSRD